MLFNFDLSQEIEAFLALNPETREYDIIRHLQITGRISNTVLNTPLSMFRCHFLIFNALYRLQLNSHVHQKYALDISSIKISMSAYSTEDLNMIEGLSTQSGTMTQPVRHKHNALSLFYLDLAHVIQTTEQDVSQLLDQFWKHYFNDDQKQNALNVLGLSEPTDFKLIKKQYRRLAMKHHPDRGGDSDQLIAVHQAMQCLEMYF